MKLIDRVSISSLGTLVNQGTLSPMALSILGRDDLALALATERVTVVRKLVPVAKRQAPKPRRVRVRSKPKAAAIQKMVAVTIKKEVRRAIAALSASKARVVQNYLGRKLGVERHQAWQGLKGLETLGKEVQKAHSLRQEWATDWYFAKARLEALYRALRFAGITLAF